MISLCDILENAHRPRVLRRSFRACLGLAVNEGVNAKGVRKPLGVREMFWVLTVDGVYITHSAHCPLSVAAVC